MRFGGSSENASRNDAMVCSTLAKLYYQPNAHDLSPRIEAQMCVLIIMKMERRGIAKGGRHT